MQDDPVRLNKHLAHVAGLSRRQADDLIEAGRVTIDGKQARLGDRYRPGQDVSIDGRPLATEPHGYRYLMLHKPVGYVCSRRAQGDAPTIYELLPPELHHLKPIGRLDKDSSGLLLLSDDGDFAHRIMHPSFHKQKTYEVTLDQPLQPLHRQMISEHGLELDDGISRLLLERLHDGDDHAWRVLMHEGRNRQIRRTFAALGYEVRSLHRTHLGTFTLGHLEPGSYATLAQPT